MKSRLTVIIFITIVCAIAYLIVKLMPFGKITGSVQLTPVITPTPSAIQYKFDKSTDLKKELDSVNPKIDDNDFSSLHY